MGTWNEKQIEELQRIADSVKLSMVKEPGEWDGLNDCIDNMVHGSLTCDYDTCLYNDVSEYTEELEYLACEYVGYLINK